MREVTLDDAAIQTLLASERIQTTFPALRQMTTGINNHASCQRCGGRTSPHNQALDKIKRFFGNLDASQGDVIKEELKADKVTVLYKDHMNRIRSRQL